MTLVKRKSPSFFDFPDLFDNKWFTHKFDSDWMPAVNISENDNSFEIEVAAPGIKKDGFDVTVEGGVLTISGKNENETEEKEKNYTRKEFSSQSFSRSFNLPDNIHEDGIVAKHEDGVLKLVLNKSEERKPSQKTIAVS